MTGNAPEEKLREVVERAQKRSAVYDIVTNGVPVAVEVTTGWPRMRPVAAPRSAHGPTTRGSEIPPCQSNSPPTPRRRAPRRARRGARADLAARADVHDRDGSYPFEAIDALKAAGYFAAPVPASSAASASRPRTTWSSRRAAWRAATRRSPSA